MSDTKQVKLAKGKNPIKNTINDLFLFKKIVRVISNIVDECKFEFKEHQILVNIMDNPRIALLDIIIYDILEKPLDNNISCNVNELWTILNFFKQDTIDFELSDKTITFKNNIKEIKLKTLSEYEDTIPINELKKIEYQCNFEIDWKTLQEITREAKFFSSIIKFCFNPEKLFVKTEGVFGDYKRTIVEGSKIGVDISTYSIPHLKTLLTGTSKFFTESFEISLRKDHPLCIKQEHSTYSLSYWLAPRVEDTYEDEEDDE